MISEHKNHCLRVLIEAATPQLETLPPQRRADAYEGIAIVAAEVADPEVCRKAETIAQQIRDAEIMQGEFKLMLKGRFE